MSEELPPGWLETPLADVCEPVSQRGPSRERETFRYVDLSALDNKAKRIAQANSVPISDAPSRAKQVIAKGDVLFSTVRVYLENIAQVPEELDGEIASTAFCVLRPRKGLDPKYLYYFVTSRRFIQAVNELQRGNSPPSVQDGDVRGQRIPLAPPREQQRIASRIDELFSDIEEGERALERVQKLVERYRQSVLKAAVTGELTREWREKHKGPLESGEALLQRILEARMASSSMRRRHPEARGPDISALAPLPQGWAWTSIEQAGAVKLGRQRAPQHHVGDHMRPYLRVANVYEDRLDLSDVKEMNFTPLEYETYALRDGDILLNEGQSPELVGRPAMYRGEVPGCCYQKTLLRFRAHTAVSAAFALLVFRYYLHCGRFRCSANITTSIAHLAAERFGPIEFPLPPELEQSEIVEVASTKLSQIDHLELELKARRKSIQVLRQATLKSAFSGNLVPQDPLEEPASVLLERLGDLHAAELEHTRVRTGRSKTKPLAKVMKEHGLQPQAQRRTRTPRGV